jgi:Arc/MetJ family transcription regulator
MRTTISINDALLHQAKRAALKSNRSLGEVVEDALRLALLPRRTSRDVPEQPLKTYGREGVQPGVDLTASAALLDLMDGR